MGLEVSILFEIGFIFVFLMLAIVIARLEFDSDYRITILIFYAFMLGASITDIINDMFTYILFVMFPMLVFFIMKKDR